MADLYDDATADIIPLSEWRYDELYEGWSADELLGMPVQGPDGDDIGEAKNLLIDEKGAIVALIAEIGGFGELGDTHVAIPWSEVERRADAVHIPITEDTVQEYGLFEDGLYSRNVELGLIGDYAYPWFGYEQGWRPSLPAYNVPYTREQIAGLTVFDYDEFEDESNL